MFGYIRPDIPHMYVKDGVLYKALYCGLCKSLGGCCGQRARMALSYDMTFLSALLHNLTNTDVRIERRRCILHPFVPRPVACDDEITRKVACLNAALAYHKAGDDVADENKGRFTRAWLHGGAKRAEKLFPQGSALIRPHMRRLHELERENCPVLDAAADPFGLLIADLSDACLGSYANEDTRALFYGIGKWVYLIDALDDYEKDVKKKNYNPFHAAFGDATRAAMLEKNGEEVDFLFRSVFAENAARLAKLHFYFNHDLTDNIILRGLPAATRRVLCGCKNTIKPNQIDWNRA